jgi:protein-tyrosine phosphatase
MEPVHLLVVCTANICRSPLAAALLQAHADHRCGAGTFVVTSAGAQARLGYPAAEGSCRIAERWGLDMPAHRSRPADRGVAEQADLILTMSRAHRDHVAALASGLKLRTFALREFARLAPQLPATGVPGEAREHLHRVAAGAHANRPLRVVEPTGDDIPDPFGGPLPGYVAFANTLVDLTEALVPIIFGPSPGS